MDIKIEKTEIWITCERPLIVANDTKIFCDGRAVSGFLGNLYRNMVRLMGIEGME